MEPRTFADLIDLETEAVPGAHDVADGVADGADTYVGSAALEPDGRTFGGQFLAQALMAAYDTVEADRFVHSMHAYFLRAGDISVTTTYQVERVRDGRGFNSRSVRAFQEDREVFRAALSFQLPEEGLEFSADRGSPEVPPPAEVDTTYQDFVTAERGGGVARWEARPLDLLYINPPTDRTPTVEPQLMWARMTEKVGTDRRRHDAALAYIADSSLLDHVFLPHGKRWEDPEVFGTTLDHSMWWHRPAKTDDWLLFEQAVEVTTGARGLTTARFYSESGQLLASCAQEGLMRWSA